MSVLIDEKLEEIVAACQRYGIERLFVFCSALRDDVKPGESDIDLLVEFGPLEITKRFHVYLDAREAFRNIFQADVVLVMQGAVKNKVIASEIDRTKSWFMVRDLSAYLQDVLEACNAIEDVICGISLEEYRSMRAVRSAEEREFIIIGEALRRVSALDERLFDYISNSRPIVTLETFLLMTTEQLMTTPSSGLSTQT
jgi:predicted nucleotidyltransferase